MDTWMSEAMVIQATLLSFLMALWIAWMSLRGLFRMLPTVRFTAVPIRAATQQGVGFEERHAG